MYMCINSLVNMGSFSTVTIGPSGVSYCFFSQFCGLFHLEFHITLLEDSSDTEDQSNMLGCIKHEPSQIDLIPNCTLLYIFLL